MSLMPVLSRRWRTMSAIAAFAVVWLMPDARATTVVPPEFGALVNATNAAGTVAGLLSTTQGRQDIANAATNYANYLINTQEGAQTLSRGIGGLSISIAGGAALGGFSASNNVSGGRYLFETWHQSTFPNKTQSILYHVVEHGKGRSAGQYTRDAMRFFNENGHLAQSTVLRDGTPGLRIQRKITDAVTGRKTRQGGYWTQNGQLVTYWD